MTDLLLTEWLSLTCRYTQNQEQIVRLWEELKTAYTHKKRHYHNLDHIGYMLGKINLLNTPLNDAGILKLSVFYHDVIYEANRKDNEEKSADLAAKRLSEIGLNDSQLDKCRKQILATKGHFYSTDADTNLLVDIDLAILGEPLSAYLLYTQKIRKEYSMYPDLLYKPGRRKVLQHFLGMDRIFKTEEFLQKL